MNEQEQPVCQTDALVQSDVQQNPAQADAPAPETTASSETPEAEATRPAVETPAPEESEEPTSAPDAAEDARPVESAAIPEDSELGPVGIVEAPIEAPSQSPSDSPSSPDNVVAESLAEMVGKLRHLLATMQTLAERVGAIETAFPILRKDVLSLAKNVSGLYTTTTDRMHAKIEKYDRGLEQTIAKPYLLSIAKIGDALRRSIASAESNPENAMVQLQSLKDDIRVPLWNAGLRVIDVEPGVTAFNPRLHDGVDIVGTGDKTLDGIVESVLETGYVFAPETDDASARPRVFRAALVRVFKFDKTLESPPPSPDAQPSSDDQLPSDDQTSSVD